MALQEPQIRALFLTELLDYLDARWQWNGASALKSAGLTPLAELGDKSEIPLGRMITFFELAAKHTRDDCLGLHAAKAFPVGATGVLYYLLRNASDLSEIVQCIRRYIRLQCEGVTVIVERAGNDLVIGCEWDATVNGPRKQLTEFLLSLFLTRLRDLFGKDWTLLAAEFDFREPNCGGEYELLFGRTLTFNAPISRLTLPGSLLNRRRNEADPKLLGILKTMADAELEKLAETRDLLAVVASYVVKNIGVRPVNLEGAAAAVSLSARQFQGALKKRETTFEEQLATIRHRLAVRYLLDTDLPMTEIAFLLGFAELSSFTRAARGWFGRTPSAYRQDHRAPVAAKP